MEFRAEQQCDLTPLSCWGRLLCVGVKVKMTLKKKIELDEFLLSCLIFSFPGNPVEKAQSHSQGTWAEALTALGLGTSHLTALPMTASGQEWCPSIRNDRHRACVKSGLSEESSCQTEQGQSCEIDHSCGLVTM